MSRARILLAEAHDTTLKSKNHKALHHGSLVCRWQPKEGAVPYEGAQLQARKKLSGVLTAELPHHLQNVLRLASRPIGFTALIFRTRERCNLRGWLWRRRWRWRPGHYHLHHYRHHQNHHQRWQPRGRAKAGRPHGQPAASVWRLAAGSLPSSSQSEAGCMTYTITTRVWGLGL